MEFPFVSKLEEYYQKFVDLQEKLRKSEEQRFVLEMKFNEMVQVGKKEQQEHYQKLRSQYKHFLEEDKKRQDRNERILRHLERIDTRISMLSAKTQRVDVLRKQYRDFMMRITHKPQIRERLFVNEKPKGSSQPPQTYISKKSFFPPEKPSIGDPFSDDHHHQQLEEKFRKEAQSNQEQLDILDKYLQSISSQKCRDFLKVERQPGTGLPSMNRATAIADDIMNSIYSRYYNKSDDELPDKRELAKAKSSNDKFVQFPSVEFEDVNSAQKSKPDVVDEEIIQQDSTEHNEVLLESKLAISDQKSTVSEEKAADYVTAKNSGMSLNVQHESYEELQKSEDLVGEEVNQAPGLLSEALCEDPTDNAFQLHDNPAEQLVKVHDDHSNYPSRGQKDKHLESEKVYDRPSEPNVDPEPGEQAVSVHEHQNNYPSAGQKDEHLESEKDSDLPLGTNVEPERDNPALNSQDAQEAIGESLQHALLESESNFVVEQEQESQNLDISEQPLEELSTNPVGGESPYYQYDEAQFNSQQEQQFYDQYGQPIWYDEHGQVVQPQYDETGQIVPQYDENGQLVMMYDQSGQSCFAEQGQYDEDGGYGDDGNQYQQNEEGDGYVNDDNQYQQNDEGDVYVDHQQYGESEKDGHQQGLIVHPQADDSVEEGSGFNEGGGQQGIEEVQSEQVERQRAEDATLQEDYRQDEPETLKENLKPEDDTTSEKHEVEQAAENPEKAHVENKMGNVMDILDTDTEASSKQNTSKVSNDSEFDFS